MPTDLYDPSQVIDKTLYARKDLAVFDGLPTATHQPKRIATVKAGQPAGVVYSWVNADPALNRANIWWIFYPGSSWGDYYTIPHDVGSFDVSTLREQGVLTLTEQAQQEADKNKEWYEKILDKALPVIAGAILAGALIRGFMSKK